RQIWNAMIDRRPAIIVRPADRGDVAPAIAFARRNALEISIRGAGHNIAGNALCNGGLTIDFANMREVRVDAERKRAWADAGATLGDFDAAAQRHGLATPIGINSTTGIAGLTLGGGFGWLTRKYGMTVDNLTATELVTADGKTLRASEAENADLFWALRGGGGNFGVVTRFEFALHAVGPEIFAGLVVFPFAQAQQILSRYRQYSSAAPESVTVWVVLRQAPPLPFLPQAVHGKEVVVLPVFSVSTAEGKNVIEQLRSFGDPHGVHAGPQPYTEWQKAFDPLLAPGARNYWKSHNFTELSDGALDAIIEYTGKLPSPQCEIFIGHIAGAANRVAPDATAYAHRDAQYVLNVHGRWDSPAQDASGIEWARAFFRASAPYASAGAYVNFMTEDEASRIAAAYGANYDRLVQLKKLYDPENVFHNNQNIKP
ncbi:MAG TPA: FAD-binding oxidoreductase, partial [Candidatus Binatia bacterium]|nr:FAD-binding oxidoreductase [Candidatus Binatia bacterium]